MTDCPNVDLIQKIKKFNNIIAIYLASSKWKPILEIELIIINGLRIKSASLTEHNDLKTKFIF